MGVGTKNLLIVGGVIVLSLTCGGVAESVSDAPNDIEVLYTMLFFIALTIAYIIFILTR
jgi:hypothetical protein